TALTRVTPAASGSSANAPSKVVVNVAVTDRAAVIITGQSAVVPAHVPPQPENVAPAAAVAVSGTVVPGANAALHVGAQPTRAGAATVAPARENAASARRRRQRHDRAGAEGPRTHVSAGDPRGRRHHRARPCFGAVDCEQERLAQLHDSLERAVAPSAVVHDV